MSRSRTLLPQHPSLLINGALITSMGKLKLLSVTPDSKLTFELQLRDMVRAVPTKLGIIHKWASLGYRLFFGLMQDNQ